MNFSRCHVLCIQETDYRPHFTCGGILYFLKHYKYAALCVYTVRMSANSVRASPQNQQTRHPCAPSWLQRCSGVFANGIYFLDNPRTFIYILYILTYFWITYLKLNILYLYIHLVVFVTLMTARVSMLLKSRASPDMLLFSLCNKKRLAIRHVNGPLFPTTLSIPS